MTAAADRSARLARLSARRALLAFVLAVLVGGLVPATIPTTARAAASDQLAVTLESVQPAALTDGSTLTLEGRLTNPTGQAWHRLQVRFFVAPEPLTSDEAVATFLADPARVTDLRRLTGTAATAAVDQLGAGESASFRVTTDWASLGLARGGVYPVAVQVVGTDAEGNRSDGPLGRATTVVPYVGDTSRTAQVSVVWPFVAPVQRDGDTATVDDDALVASVSPGGRLRRILDLAREDPAAPSTVLLDPALLDALRDVAAGTSGPARRGGPGGDESPDLSTPRSGTAEQARAFLSELLAYATRHPVWAVPYGRPDVAALTRKSAGPEGQTVVEATRTATRETLAQFGISATIVYAPPGGITTRSRTDRSRALGAQTALVSSSVLPGWKPSTGSALTISAGSAPMPTVVLDPTLQVEGGQAQTLALRQRVVARAALSVLAGDDAPTVVVPSFSFDPGAAWSRASFSSLFDLAWISPASADSQLEGAARPWTGRVQQPENGKQRPISTDQVDAAARIVEDGTVAAEILGGNRARTVFYDQSAALAVSQDWRAARTRGTAHARAQADEIRRTLSKVTVSANSFVTLSGSSGRFPVTISNGLGSPVVVGVSFASDNARARIEDIPAQQIQPHQSVTITVNADVGQATATGFTARLVTESGTALGEQTTFTVRSSVVGRIIWVFLGLALLLVVVAVARRIVKRRRAAATDDDEADDEATPPTPGDSPESADATSPRGRA